MNETNQTVDFDADSEGSDCETPFIRHDMQEQLHHTDNTNNIKQITNNTMEIKVENRKCAAYFILFCQSSIPFYALVLIRIAGLIRTKIIGFRRAPIRQFRL